MTRFRQKCGRVWRSIFGGTETVPPDAVPAEVTVARFLFSSSHFSQKAVRSAAFMPRLNEQRARWETSAFQIDALEDAAIWQIGAEVVEPFQGKPAKARAEVTVGEIRHATLDVDSTPAVHPRHVDIVLWQDAETPEERRSKQQLQATALALVARPKQRIQ